MANIARNAVKEPTTLRTPQNAIWCGMWVVSLGLLLIAGLDILATYGCSLNSVVVVGAVGLGPLLVLTMLCGFNMSETPEKDAFNTAAREQTGQFRQASNFHRARRQLKWNSLVRPPVRARISPLDGRHLQPDYDHDGQRHHPEHPYLRGTVLKMAFPTPIVALALIASSADVANAWPSGLEPASAMYWCSSAAEINTKDAFTVWVDKSKQVVAVSASRNGAKLPVYAEQLVGNEGANSGFSIRKVKTGYFLTPGTVDSSHQFKIASTVATCKQTSED